MVKIKIAFAVLKDDHPDPPLGLAYLASYLRKYGGFNDIVIVDKEDPLKRLKKEKPDIIGLSALTHEFHDAKRLANVLKETFDVPLIIGGYHISLMPHHFKNTSFDIGVIREGEQTMLELAKIFDSYGCFPEEKLKKTKGIIYRSGSNVKMTEERPLIEPLDSIPYPARDLLKMKNYYLTLRSSVFRKLGIYTSMLTSRGCPYKCVFCCNTQYWRRARLHSPEYVVGEMKEIYDKYRPDGLILFDDLFIADKSRIKKLVDLMAEDGLNEKMSFYVYGRANLINKEMCEMLKKMNIKGVEFGLESGSEKILKYLKGGSVTLSDNINALKLCKQYGFITAGSFITGAPHETEDDLAQTRILVNDKNLDNAHVYQMTPLPGTEIWNVTKRIGIVSDDENFNFSQLRMRVFRDDMILSDVDKKTYRKMFLTLFKEAEDKRNKFGSNNPFSGIKLRHMEYIFRPRFLKKIISQWKIALQYVQNSIKQ